MSNITDDNEKRFWNNYIALLAEYDIQPELYQWDVKHCEKFIRCYTEIRLKNHTQETLTQYLSSILQKTHLETWQNVRLLMR